MTYFKVISRFSTRPFKWFLSAVTIISCFSFSGWFSSIRFIWLQRLRFSLSYWCFNSSNNVLHSSIAVVWIIVGIVWFSLPFIFSNSLLKISYFPRKLLNSDAEVLYSFFNVSLHFKITSIFNSYDEWISLVSLFIFVASFFKISFCFFSNVIFSTNFLISFVYLLHYTVFITVIYMTTEISFIYLSTSFIHLWLFTSNFNSSTSLCINSFSTRISLHLLLKSAISCSYICISSCFSDKFSW